MNILPLRRSMILQKRLTMLPTRETTHPLTNLRTNNIEQTIPTGVPEDRALHMRGLEFPSVHE